MHQTIEGSETSQSRCIISHYCIKSPSYVRVYHYLSHYCIKYHYLLYTSCRNADELNSKVYNHFTKEQ